LGVVFDIIPERIVAPMVATDAEPLYWAALLAVRNPTVIAFMMIWLVGTVRQMLLTRPPQRTWRPGRQPRHRGG
jgi:hypothetical protein